MLKNLRVASPCKADWDRMVGDDRVRHCAECDRKVYNLVAMTSAEVEDLIKTRTGRLCGRLYQRRDGTFLTSDCPVRFELKIRRIPRVAEVALTAIMSVSGAAAQMVSNRNFPPATPKQSKQNKSGLRVEVFNQDGKPIENANVRIRADKGVGFGGVTDKNGSVQADIPPGSYTVWVDDPGFISAEVKNLEITHQEQVVVHLKADTPIVVGEFIPTIDHVLVRTETVDVPNKIEPRTSPPHAEVPEKKNDH